MTDQKKTDPNTTATDIDDAALDDAQGGFATYRMSTTMVNKFAAPTNGGVRAGGEDDEPIAMNKASVKGLNAAFDIEELGVLRKRPGR